MRLELEVYVFKVVVGCEVEKVDVIKAETSIVFVVVTTGCSEEACEAGGTTDAVIVVVADEDAAPTLIPFLDCPGGKVGRWVGSASIRRGWLRNARRAIYLMSKISRSNPKDYTRV